MNGLRTFTLPCSLMNLRGLEQFFTDKAKAGYLLRGFGGGGGAGKFETVLKDDYHFCVDVYRKEISEEEQGEIEFTAYIDECEELGWTFSCTCHNLVIFYKKGGERPPELKRNRIIIRNYLEDVTMPAERRILIRQALAGLAVFTFWLAVVAWGIFRDRRMEAVEPWMLLIGVVILIPVINQSGTIAKWVQQKTLLKDIKARRPLQPDRSFWNEEAIVSAAGLAVGLWMSFWSYRAMAVKSAFFSFWTVVISAGILFLVVWRRRTGKSRSFALLTKGSSILSILFMVGALLVCPTQGSYRFQMMPGERHTNQTEEERRILDLGLNLEEAGLGKKGFAFYHENKNPCCVSETIIYQIEEIPLPVKNNSEYVKSIRYAGTAIAQLKNPGSLERYLKQKHLNLRTWVPFELEEGTNSYLSDSGKEMIHMKGDWVVLFFLSSYDDRSFELEKVAGNEVYKKKLKAIEEMEPAR